MKKRRLPSKSGLPVAPVNDSGHSTPSTEPLSQSIASKSEAEPSSQPAKRRRVSQGSVSSSPRQALYTSPGARMKVSALAITRQLEFHTVFDQLVSMS